MKLNAINEIEAIQLKIKQERKAAFIIVAGLAALMLVTAVFTLVETL